MAAASPVPARAADMQTMQALGGLIAMQERCDLTVDEAALAEFVGGLGDPAKTLSSFTMFKAAAEFELREASDLEMVVRCAALRKFGTEHDLLAR